MSAGAGDWLAQVHETVVQQATGSEEIYLYSGLAVFAVVLIVLSWLTVTYRTEAEERGVLEVSFFRLGDLLKVGGGIVLFVAILLVLWKNFDTKYPLPLEHTPAPPPGHKDLLPLDESDYIGVTLSLLGLLLAAGGGIGGGGILVPVYILAFGFPQKRAIPLSNITIFGGSIANCLANWPARHPWSKRCPPGKKNVDRPLIDFDLVLAMEPLTIAGAIIGSLLNKLLPSMLVTVLLILVLGYTAYNTLSKAWKLYQKEVKQNEEQKDGEPEEKEVLFDREPTACFDPLLEAEKMVPWDKIFALVILFIGCMGMNFLKGGPPDALDNPLWATCGGKVYWLMLLLQVPWCGVLAWLVRSMLLKQHEARETRMYDFSARAQFEWNDTTTIKYPLICSLAGLFAGLFGIGGGIVKGPLMIAMDVHPEVSSATAAFMIFFTASSATLSYALFGLLTLDYALVFFVMGFVATYVGQYFVKKIVKATGHPSMVAVIIGLTVAVSTILMGFHGIRTILTSPDPWSSPPLCDFPVLYSHTKPDA